MTFEIVKSNYEKELWSEAMVKVAVGKGVISQVQYQQITGKKYTVNQ